VRTISLATEYIREPRVGAVNNEMSLLIIETTPTLEKLKTPPFVPAEDVVKVSPYISKSKLGLSMKNAPPSSLDDEVAI
jgi:hypothetical protein